MKKTGLNELRESYLKFFEGKDHLRLESAPLIPKDDNSILLINAGMTPLKKYFQGTETPPRKRAASCQKCIRTPDIENVGYTSRHGTYFEMLGNFSFGDYFKSEACAWAWEYFTKVLEIPIDLLWVSVYEEDDEAAEIWEKEVGIAADRIIRFGKADNFWEHGSGPCGPCSEIYFDRGADKGCESPDCKVGCDCDRYIEVWNLVFTQFDSDGKGNYSPLANKNIDTGMGLERLACVMQDVDNLFEVDTIRNIMNKVCSIVKKEYKKDAKDDISIRIITDHIRSTVFMIGDGVLPTNEGRGYVLRRLLRRAARHGRLLGYEKPFLYEVCDTVIDENINAYPELKEKREYIKKTIKTEEDSFAKTVAGGLKILSELIAKLPQNGVLAGEEAFRLHDTYGFPLDLTKEILAEKGLTLDEEKFRELMQVQKDTARANQAFKGGWDNGFASLDAETLEKLTDLKTEFVGYETNAAETKIIAIIENGKIVKNCSKGENAWIMLEKTPFYAESGGQVGDTGWIDDIIYVHDTKKLPTGQSVCHCIIESATFEVGQEVTAHIDGMRRSAISANHTAAHLLHASLRKVLGPQVRQAGSLVDSERCRFDFTHGQALTPEELLEVEYRINSFISESFPVETKTMTMDDAKKIGAIALFDEKYGDIVRTVSILGFSTELCGGTHVRDTAEIGMFKIISETSVAAGVRRIEAVTGWGVLELLNVTQRVVEEAAKALKLSNPTNLIPRCNAVMAEIAELKKEKERLSSIIAGAQVSKAELTEAGEVNGVKLFTMKLSGADTDALRKAGDRLKDEKSCFAAVIAGESNLFCLCDKAAVEKGLNAGNIVRKVAEITGGKGGGRADSAMAGIGDASKVDEALSKLSSLIS